MYEFIINGIAVTREEFASDSSVFTSDEIYELFDTGSVTVNQITFEIRAAGVGNE